MRRPVDNEPRIRPDGFSGKRNLGVSENESPQCKQNDFHGLLHLLVRAMQRISPECIPTEEGRRFSEFPFSVLQVRYGKRRRHYAAQAV